MLLSLRSLSLLLLLLLLLTELVANVEIPEAGVARLGLFVVVFEELPPPDAVAGHVEDGDEELLALRMLLM